MNMHLGQKYWSRAKEVISGGTMLFSKNPDLHLPRLWPAYYSKAKGCNIWDLQNKKYKDIFLMGVGTNTLGYAYKPLEKKIIETLKKGNMSSLNSPEEILLAEKLLEIHNWADLVKFTRSGGEANSVAIRIARAATGKDNVAICGYHGWHDWYLASNLKNKENLNTHLIKNLSVKGVPKVLGDTVFPFEYNNIAQLKKIIDEKNIGTVKMEVQRNIQPKKNFLKEVRNICDNKKIVLIFDECTSGFRSCYGGLHLEYKINPDIAIFGKALGNGHAINAIIGKKEIMENTMNTFISSTFWTERIGSVAGLETLNLMKKIESWKIISKIGRNIKKNWNKIAKENSLNIKIQGIDALPNFNFETNSHNLYKTYISQEMLKKNILASNAVYTCINHSDKILSNYFDKLNDIFKMINKCENQEENIHNLLETSEAITGIRNN
jgi:glutamate-1-semialdehyde 2,1-aminomutase